MTSKAPEKEASPRHPVDGPRIEDELHLAFPAVPTTHIFDPVDGIPRPVMPASITDSLAPKLSPNDLVCMGDLSEYVVRSKYGNILAVFPPEDVVTLPTGQTVVTRETARAVLGAYEDTRLRARVVRLLGVVRRFWSGEEVDEGAYVTVEPIRPQCVHYARQLIPFPDSPEARLAVRLCTARRDDEGEFVSMGNASMLACELRSPSIGNNQAVLHEYDERIMALARKVAAEDDFDVDAALRGEAER